MGISVHISGCENEAGAELKRVLAQTALAMSARLGPLPGPHVLRVKQVKESGAPQAGRAICLPLFVDQEGKIDPGIFAKKARIMRVSESYCGNPSAFLLECSFVLAQLRHMLPAKNSAVVTQKN